MLKARRKVRRDSKKVRNLHEVRLAGMFNIFLAVSSARWLSHLWSRSSYRLPDFDRIFGLYQAFSWPMRAPRDNAKKIVEVKLKQKGTRCMTPP
jgi:hypothetical protein